MTHHFFYSNLISVIWLSSIGLRHQYLDQHSGLMACPSSLSTSNRPNQRLISNKTAELSQRRPRDAPNIWVPWKVLRVLTTHPATFPEICRRLLFRSILRMCVQKLKFVALPVPEIIRGTQKIWAVPGYAHAPFSPKILKGFCSDGPC